MLRRWSPPAIRGSTYSPTGHASITFGQSVKIDGPKGPKTVKLAFLRLWFFAVPVWLDSDNHFFGNAGVISLMPDGYEGRGPSSETLQDQATPRWCADIAHQFLRPASIEPRRWSIMY